jgi:hypothetical protein
VDLGHSHPHLRVRLDIDNRKIWLQALDPGLDGVTEMEMEVGVMILDESVNEVEEGGGEIEVNHQKGGIGIMDMAIVGRIPLTIRTKINLNHKYKKGKGKDHLLHHVQYPRLRLKPI